MKTPLPALLAVVSWLAMSASAAASGPALRPLTARTLGSGSITLVTRQSGLEATLVWPREARVAGRLVGPRGRSGAWVTLTGRPARGVLARPGGPAADRDLRLVLRVGVHGAPTRYYVAAVSRFLDAPRVLLLGDPVVQAGSRYAPRIVVRTPAGAVVGAEVRAVLRARGKKRPGRAVATVSAVTGPTGAPDMHLVVPPDARGSFRLEVRVRSDVGTVEARFDLTVQRSARVLLSTDKPIYQPGQRVHLRVLARRRGDGRAAGGAPARLTISDAKGNKVFQKSGRTSPQGVFSSTFDIAELVNTGRWRIEARVGGTAAVRTVEVKPYVLPKFKVEVAADRPSYEPGQRVAGTVTARYFFGKPLDGAEVVIRARTFDVTAHEIARVALTLDPKGTARFEVPLPSTLHGSPLAGGAATVRLEATVTDTAGQSVHAARTVPVWKAALRITVLPEAGRMVAGLENRIYILVTRPDGAPVPRAELEAAYGSLRRRLVTDAFGVAELSARPASPATRLRLVARAPDGATAEHSAPLTFRARQPTAVLLRPDDPAPRAGQEVGFEVLVSGAVPHVFLDLIRDGQTLLTLSAPVEAGRARLRTLLPPEAAGTLLAHAYVLGDDMEVTSDTRPLVVRMASDLTVAVIPDRTTYRPGQDVSVRLKVTDGAGHGVLAALGLWVVDEAVYALSENRPGLEQVFFLLEQEIMRPKVEIHGFEPADALTLDDADPAPTARRRRAARVLAAAAMPAFSHTARVDSSADARRQSTDLWRAVLAERVPRLNRALRTWMTRHKRLVSNDALLGVLERHGLVPGATRDPFGVPFALNITRSRGWVGDAQLLSAGPDALMGTADDIRVPLGVTATWRKVQQALWRKRHAAQRKRARRPIRFMMGRGGGFGMRGAGVGGGGSALGRVAVRHPMLLRGGGGGDRLKSDPGAARPAGHRGTGAVRTVSRAGAAPEVDAPRVRAFFPETLFAAPLIVTDAAGEARVGFPAADSITTWRLSATASTADGRLGSKDHGIRVFQDFFVDVELPTALTRGDEITVPVAVYNYLDRPQTVTLDLEPDGGLTVQGGTRVTLELGPGEVRGHQATLTASTVGSARLPVTARGSRLSDAVRRDLRVEPDGFPVQSTRAGTLAGPVTLELGSPEGAIPQASTLQVKLYPGMFAQVVDGLDSMLRMPSGCFEQTSSATYPNALVLAYLRSAKKSRPELEAKALRYLQAGWQRLVTYEVTGGGFSWFGQAPANTILTAYGLMEFHDMKAVTTVDTAVLARTRRWLERRQKADGSFAPDAQFLHAESWGDIQKSSLLVTAYVAWALAYSRPARETIDPRLRKALDWLARRAPQAEDPYVLSYLANAFAEAVAGRTDAGADRATLAGLLGRLAALGRRDGKTLHYETGVRTATHGSGQAAAIEVTALALRAFMRAGGHADRTGPGLAWLVGTKSAWGNWYSTQATIQVLQAMLASLSATQKAAPGAVDVVVNGDPVARVTYTAEDFDVVRFVDASRALRPGRNTVELRPTDGLEAMYSVSATAYLPWSGERRPDAKAFDVRVEYDRSRLAKDDVARATVSVTSNLPTGVEMGIVDVGIPPGFALDVARLEAAVKQGVLQRFSQAGRQLILYVPRFEPGKTFSVSWDLRARFPVRASTGPARAYEYYNPDSQGVAPPGAMTVR